jgi:hypothetical protein
MNETKHANAQETTTHPVDAQADRRTGEIRLLEDYELVLAGGGDDIIGWP